jgi:hypothetical protein
MPWSRLASAVVLPVLVSVRITPLGIPNQAAALNRFPGQVGGVPSGQRGIRGHRAVHSLKLLLDLCWKPIAGLPA